MRPLERRDSVGCGAAMLARRGIPRRHSREAKRPTPSMRELLRNDYPTSDDVCPVWCEMDTAVGRQGFSMTTTQHSIMFSDLVNPREMDAGDASDGWYTPPWLIEMARALLGGFNTDPATCAAAQAIVKADNWYTEAENGLEQVWTGTLWLNPPYSGPTKWTDKALGHYLTGDVSAALILTNSYTETGWWQRLAAQGTMLFFSGRLNFWHPLKTSTQNRTGQTLCYLGTERQRFVEIFGRLGVIR